MVDGSAMARSAAAVVHGFRTFDPDVQVAGVILNRLGSGGHEQLLREAITTVPVLGALHRDERLTVPERHLGLVPAGEREARATDALDAIALAVAQRVDLGAVQRIARAAPALPGPAWSPGETRWHRARIAIARGPAFSFHYEENLELLQAAGAELAPFDPTTDETLPADTAGLVLAGGFPEVYGAELAANAPLRRHVAALAAAGRPVLAECGGLLYLARELDGHAMCGVLPARARMGGRLTLGYREAAAATATPWQEARARVRGHEFHYSDVEADGEAAPAWSLTARGQTRTEGFVAGGVQASYLHVHWAAHPEIPDRFVAAAARA